MIFFSDSNIDIHLVLTFFFKKIVIDLQNLN
jgi:hypothetical protein